MNVRIQIVAIAAAAGLLFLLLELVRRRRLLERYALLWMFSAAVLLVLAIWRGLLADIADLLGIAYPPNALFLVAFGFVLVLLLHFSLAVSRLSDQTKVLAQRLALLEERQPRPATAQHSEHLAAAHGSSEAEAELPRGEVAASLPHNAERERLLVRRQAP